MSGPKEEIENYINRELPANFSSDEIYEMYEAVVKDVTLLKKAVGMTEQRIGLICQKKYKQFAFSYPLIFFRTIKGEMKPEMLKSILSLKKKLDNKDMSLDEARMGVIDGAKKDIERNPKESRPQKPKGDVQELTVMCKPDGSTQG